MTFSTTRAERLLAVAVLGILLFFLGSIVCIWGLDKTLIPTTDVLRNEREKKIDWKSLYPFPDERKEHPAGTEHEPTEKLSWIERTARALKNFTKFRTGTEKLFGYFSLVTSANEYEKFIGWNFSPYHEYNGIVKLHDGFVTDFVQKVDISKAAQNTIAFAKFCKNRDIDFLYVNAPHKICKFEDRGISGVLDFSNQNADEFLQMLAGAGVDYYDFRQVLHDEGLSHHGAFFRTDHHWLPETGLWAARHLLRLLRDKYNYPVDASPLDEDKFTSVIYPSWFLGSGGKKITLALTTADDFTLLYPKYPTSLHYQIPNLGINVSGDFSITYDMSQVEERDFYNKNPYGAYNYGSPPLVKIENTLVKNKIKILVIKDSFANCVVPFLAMEIRQIDVLSLGDEAFNGNLKNYITSTNPDIIILLYYAKNVGAFGFYM